MFVKHRGRYKCEHIIFESSERVRQFIFLRNQNTATVSGGSDVIDTCLVIGWIPSMVSKSFIKLLFLATIAPRTVSVHRRRI